MPRNGTPHGGGGGYRNDDSTSLWDDALALLRRAASEWRSLSPAVYTRRYAKRDNADDDVLVVDEHGASDGLRIPRRGFHYRHEYTLACAKVCVQCIVAHAVLARTLPRVLPARWTAGMSRAELTLHLPQQLISWYHGAYVGLVCAHFIGVRGGSERRVLDGYDFLTLDNVFAFNTGYAVYDLVNMLMHGDDDARMFVHHACEVVGSYLIGCYRQMSFFPSFFSITELTVCVQNVAWMMQRFGLHEQRQPSLSRVVSTAAMVGGAKALPSQRYVNVLGARALVYVLLRLPVGPLAMWYAFTRGGLTLRRAVSDTPAVVSTLSVLIVCAVGFLNLGWSYNAVMSFLRARQRLLEVGRRVAVRAAAAV